MATIDINSVVITPTGGSTGRFLPDWFSVLIVSDATASRSLTAADHGVLLYFTIPATVIVPAGLPATFYCGILQGGGGQVTLVASATTLNEPDNYLKTEKQWAVLSVTALALDNFLISGRTAP